MPRAASPTSTAWRPASCGNDRQVEAGPPGFRTTGHASTPSRRRTPESEASLDAPSLERAQGRPGAGWHPRSAVRKLRENRCTAAYRAARTSRPFPAQWFDGLWRALPGERCTIAPVVLRITGARTRSGRFTTASLDAQTPGVRTTRFCRTRTASVVCAPLKRSRAKPALRLPARRCTPRPPPPGPRIVTIAKRPLSMGRHGDAYTIIPNFGQAEF